MLPTLGGNPALRLLEYLLCGRTQFLKVLELIKQETERRNMGLFIFLGSREEVTLDHTIITCTRCTSLTFFSCLYCHNHLFSVCLSDIDDSREHPEDAEISLYRY